jgi:hypothetical protein
MLAIKSDHKKSREQHFDQTCRQFCPDSKVSRKVRKNKKHLFTINQHRVELQKA